MPFGSIGFVSGFLGGVAADEPQAALIGRNVLSSGGSAADAAVAVYFSLAVTMPSTASLGGGGVCMVWDAASGKAETLDFMGVASNAAVAGGRAVNLVPGNPMGFFSLHAKYGRLKWAELIRPAENMARFGHRVSRALAADIRRQEAVLVRDPATRSIFRRSDGAGLVREGDILIQLDLSSVLAQIRARGAAALYRGPLAREFVDAVNASGGSLDYEDMRTYTATWRGTFKIPYTLAASFYFPMTRDGTLPWPAIGTALLAMDDRYEDADPAERPHLLAEALRRARGDDRRSFGSSRQEEVTIQEDHLDRLWESYRTDRLTPVRTAAEGNIDRNGSEPGNSFVVIDSQGSAVACSLIHNQFFGMGRVARGTGVFPSMASVSTTHRLDGIGAMLLASKVHKAVYLAAAASGDEIGLSAMLNVAARAAMGTPDDLETAIARKRIHSGEGNGATYYEEGLESKIVDGLSRRGHRMRMVPALGRVNAAFCPSGLPAKNITCSVKTDPRGFGLAASGD